MVSKSSNSSISPMPMLMLLYLSFPFLSGGIYFVWGFITSGTLKSSQRSEQGSVSMTEKGRNLPSFSQIQGPYKRTESLQIIEPLHEKPRTRY